MYPGDIGICLTRRVAPLRRATPRKDVCGAGPISRASLFAARYHDFEIRMQCEASLALGWG